MFVYLPSCKLTRACPEADRKIRAYLSRRDDMRIAGCCSVAVREMIAADTAITACMSCAAIVRENGAQGGQVSLWEYLAADAEFPWPDFGGEAITIQDCWRARNDSALHDAVRECMHKMHIRVVEIAGNRENCEFDGVWRMNPLTEPTMKRAPQFFGDVAVHGIEPVPKEEQPQRMREWAAQYATDRVTAYCNACLNGIKLGGANGVHLLELATENIGL